MGRKAVQEGFAKYFAAGGHQQGSALTKARFNANHKYGVSFTDMGNFEVGLLVGLLLNTVPATFWALFYVFSNPPLLADLRNELSTIEQTGIDHTEDQPTRHVNITQAMVDCPLLMSLFQETLRLQATAGSSRVVLQDTVLNDQYLLREGALIHMPARTVHADPANWGPSATQFDPRRFIKKDQKRGDTKVPMGSFQTFGGGTTLCPGRHLASNEVVSVLVMFVLQFDITPAQSGDGGGEWIMPSQTSNNMSNSMVPPDHDIQVYLRKRKGCEHISWQFSIGK